MLPFGSGGGDDAVSFGLERLSELERPDHNGHLRDQRTEEPVVPGRI